MHLTESVLKNVIEAGLNTGASFVDIFIEETISSNLNIKNNELNQFKFNETYGAGIRLIFGHDVVYTTTSDLSENNLIKAVADVSQIYLKSKKLNTTKSQHKIELHNQNLISKHKYGLKSWETDINKKLNFLKSIDQKSRETSSYVTQVKPGIIQTNQKIQIANSQGLLIADERNYTRIFNDVYVEQNGVIESASERDGVLGTSEWLEQINLDKFTHQLTQQALALTKASYAPAGEMPVIIDNGFGGVIFHEACGHGLETTVIAKGASVFSNKLNTKIANTCVTAIDDGTLISHWGSLNIDDEGMPTQKTTLIENGILKSYIVDYVGSLETGFPRTGSGRRESYKFAPASRMRNTYIAAGMDSFEDMVKDIDYGLFAHKMGGGSVNPVTGEFNFQVRQGYIIRQGRIEELVKGACLIGRGFDTLANITKVSKNLKLEIGTCGSISGQIPTTVGQPQILVSKLIVGGRV